MSSFSASRWPLAKSAADMRLRPSSCTSTSSSAPSPQATTGGFTLTQPARRAPAALSSRARAARCAASGRERRCKRRATVASRARGCEWPRAGWHQSIRPSSFFEQRRVGGLRRILLFGDDRARRQTLQRPHQQLRAHLRQARGQLHRGLLRPDAGFRLQQHVAGIEAGIDPHGGDAGAWFRR